ncbi:MAG: RIP metalloprotease RseP [Candidatus Omnitrophica bacterium 4484_171]|nr:MAG: RIP metalloprotease RseP [Candidatus Omnitrophica bacterium 4484_171]
MWLINILVFTAILSVLIITHELGHFIAARMSGIRVEKFSIGFGPVIFKKEIKGTQFLVSVVPLGGYVKMSGDERDACKGKEHEFFSKPLGVRAKVIFFGPLANYVFSFLLIWVLFIMGMPEYNTTVGTVVKGTPAEAAGLKEQDKIIRINGKKINRWEALQKAISTSRGDIIVSVLRNGKEMNFTITPKVEPLKDIFGRSIERRMIGVSPGATMVKYNFFTAFFKGTKYTIRLTFMILKGFYYMVTGAIPLSKSVAGPIKLFEMTSSVFKQGIMALMSLVSFIGISLAIINLFPIPVLDGGHLFLIGLEKIRKKPLSDKMEAALTRIGIAIISLIMFFVFYNDIAGIIMRK